MCNDGFLQWAKLVRLYFSVLERVYSSGMCFGCGHEDVFQKDTCLKDVESLVGYLITIPGSTIDIIGKGEGVI